MPVNPIIVVEGLKVITGTISAVKEYAIEREREKTERQRIALALEAYLRKLEVESQNFVLILQQRHEERLALYAHLEIALSTSAERGDIKMFEIVTATMLKIYEKGPNPQDAIGLGSQQAGHGFLEHDDARS
jgi:hypothetical protein